MHDNIFLISDASHCSTTKSAGIAVIDKSTNKKYVKHLENIKDSHEAEMRALIFSAKIALKNSYDNVVFVYDCKSLPINLLKNYLDKHSINYQFLWLKRKYIKNADKLAKIARLTEHFIIDTVTTDYNKPKKKKVKLTTKKINYHILRETIRNKPIQQIIQFCSYIASEEEMTLINCYFRNTKLPSYIPTKSGVDLLMFLYQMLPKDKRKNFYLFVANRIPSGDPLHRKLIKDHPSSFYNSRMERILSIRSDGGIGLKILDA